MKMAQKAIMLFLIVMLYVPTAVVTAYGSSSGSGAGVIDITGDGSGIKIKPGEAPDMTHVGNLDDIGNKVISKSQMVAKTVTSVCTIICFVAFLFSVTRLATSGSHPIQRRGAVIGILWSGVALALFGGGWVVVNFFWNFLS